jgi:tetratricopeptide (TPR) repeat protein
MIHGKSKVYLTLFTIGLLFFAIIIRSGAIVDRSFLPRFLLLAVILLVTYLLGFRKKILIRNTFFECSFILFYLWNLLSCFWAIAPSEAIMQSQLVFISLALFLIITALNNENKSFENIFIRTHLVVLSFSFVLAFYKMSVLPFFDPYKIISVSANNNLYSGFLLISLPLVFTGYSINSGFWKYFSVLVGIFAVFFIIITQSRAAYIGLSAATFVSLLFLITRYPGVFSGKNITVGAIAIIILFSGVLVFYYSLDSTRKNYFLSKVPVWEYFRSYENATAERMLKKRHEGTDLKHMAAFDFSEEYYENANLRIIFWKKSLCLIKSNPFAGVGSGNWKINVPSCKEPINPDHTAKNYTYSQPHNEWIGIISELGITGFLLSLFIFIVPVAFVFYRIGFTLPRPHISVVYYGSFIFGFYLFTSFDFPFHRVEHNVVFFSVFAFLLKKVSMKQGRFRILGRIPQLRDDVLGINVLKRRKGEKRRIYISAVFVLLLVFSVFIAFIRLKGEYYTLKMFSNERRNDDKVILYYRKAESPFYKITPNTLPLAWFEGVAYYRKGELKSAQECFKMALKSTPYEVRVLNDYAASLFDLHKPDDAKSVLVHTLDIDPWFDDARFNLAAIYYFEGKNDSARICISRCRDSQKKEEFLKELK